jgi:hypothetical protein
MRIVRDGNVKASCMSNSFIINGHMRIEREAGLAPKPDAGEAAS